ncbi:MAG: hypothetical protein ABEL76_08160, partial [Bradymonadaceae bacterium]
MSERVQRWAVLTVLCAGLAGSSCRCADRIRRMVSNSGEGVTRTPFQADAGGQAGPAESEPNDSAANAQRVRLGGALDSLGGEIADPGDVDW